LAIASFALTGSAFASLTTCPTATYDVYLAVANFTCTSGALLFSNFTYSGTAAPAGNAIPASGVMVTPQTVTGNEGFQFASGWNVATQAGPPPTGSFEDSLIGFEVQGPITDLHLFFNGSFTGTGLTAVTENYCINHTLSGCPIGPPSQGGQLMVTNPPPAFNDQTFFPGTVQSIFVSKDINASSGVNGTAHISQVINNFSNTPEPMTLMLFGSGLLGLGLFRKRLKS